VVPFAVLLAGALFDMSLAATVLAKLAVVIVLTLALDAGFTSTTTLSAVDRALATGSADIFTSAITN
jgi:hypothetical protein